MQKNVAGQKIGAQLVSATDGSAFTGSVTVRVTGDAGTQATGSVGSGACTHEGNGYHTYAPAQAETNYDLIAFTFTGTGAVPATVQVFTHHDANITHLSGSSTSLADLKHFVDDCYDPSNTQVSSVGTVDTLLQVDTGAITASSFANNAITVSAIAASAITSSEAPALQYLTGDAFARLGAPVGASISADIAAVPTANITGSKTIYISFTGGNDSNSGLLKSAPKATFASAHSAASDGDTISVLTAGGVFNTPWNCTKRVILTSDNYNATALVIPEGESQYAIRITKHGCTIKNLFAQMNSANTDAGVGRPCILIAAGVHNTLCEYLDLDAPGPCIKADSTIGTVIRHCNPASNTPVVSLVDSSAFVVEHSLIAGGAIVKELDPLFQNDTVYQNNPSYLVLCNEFSRGVIRYNEFQLDRNTVSGQVSGVSTPFTNGTGDAIGLVIPHGVECIGNIVTIRNTTGTGDAVGYAGSVNRLTSLKTDIHGGVIETESTGGDEVPIDAAVSGSNVNTYGGTYEFGDCLGQDNIHPLDANVLATKAAATTAASAATTAATSANSAASTASTLNTKLGTPAGASVSADIAGIHAKTTNLPASPAAVGSAMTLADDAINSDTFADGALGSIGTVVPVNQVAVPVSRTWVLKQTSDGLVGERTLSRRVGEEITVAVDFRTDLPVNGRLQSLDAVTFESDVEEGIEISEADEDRGVDRSQAKFKINLVEAGTYVLTVAVSYDDDVASEGEVTLVVRA